MTVGVDLPFNGRVQTKEAIILGVDPKRSCVVYKEALDPLPDCRIITQGNHVEGRGAGRAPHEADQGSKPKVILLILDNGTDRQSLQGCLGFECSCLGIESVQTVIVYQSRAFPPCPDKWLSPRPN